MSKKIPVFNKAGEKIQEARLGLAASSAATAALSVEERRRRASVQTPAFVEPAEFQEPGVWGGHNRHMPFSR